MDLIVDSNTFIVFDLDDTLYDEIEFLKSGFLAVANYLEKILNVNIFDEMMNRFNSGEEVFEYIIKKYKIDALNKENLIEIYRNHYPKIKLRQDALNFLNTLLYYNVKLGIITDGREITQKNKLRALGILGYFNLVIISEEFGSEKPSLANYKVFEEKFPYSEFFYFGDNFKKDFLAPNKLGWKTFGLLDRGSNIHTQLLDVSSEYLPQQIISSFEEIKIKSNL